MKALKHKGFAQYLSVVFISYIGLWVERITLGWLAWEISGSVFWTSVVAISAAAPSAFLGPFLGVWAENRNMRNAYIIVNLALSVVSFSLFLYVFFDTPNIYILVFISLLTGIISSFTHPIRLVIINQIVPHNLLSNAVGLHAAGFNLTRILGPAIAGLSIATIGAEYSLLINPISFLPAILVISFLNFLPQPKLVIKDENYLQALLRGIQYAFGDPIIRWCLIMTALNAMVVRGVLEITPAIVGDILNGSSTELALITTAAGIGALAAALTLSFLTRKEFNIGLLAIVCLPIGAISVMLIGVFKGPDMMAILMSCAAFFTTAVSISTQTIVHLNVNDRYRGRTLTWWTTLSLSSVTVSGLIVGLFGDFVDTAMVLIFLGAFGVLGSIWALFARPYIKYNES